MADLSTKAAAPSGSQLSTNETLVDLYVERAIDLLRLEAGTRDKVLLFLHDLEQELAALVAKVDPTGVDQVSAQRRRLQKLLDLIRASIKGTYRDISTLMAREIRDIADIEATWTASAIDAATKVSFTDAAVTKPFLDAVTSDVLIQGATSKDWWGRQAAGLANKFADEMRRGMVIGEANSDLVTRARSVMDLSRTSAERLVRASVQATANTAREAMYQQNTDLIKALQWHATLDTRTSIWCITRDAHQYSPDDAHKPLDKGPPWMEGPGKIHWGCRSTSVPVLKSWKDLGIDAEEVPPSTRASMDGQVPEKTSFEAWLKKQSTERQNTVLGIEKARLWRAGKITFRDLLDQNGRPLTTEELRAKAAKK